jgi:phage host-nuclease inhibitor protein Gam
MNEGSSAAAAVSASTVGSLQREPERLRQEARALQGALEELYRSHYEVSKEGREV